MKSLFSVVGTANTFAGDIIQKEVAELGAVSIIILQGVSTITSATLSFPELLLKSQYSRPNFTSNLLLRLMKYLLILL